MVEKVVNPVRQFTQGGARHPLGVIDQLGHICGELFGAVMRRQLDDRLLGDMTGGELRAQIAEHLDRHPHILLDQREQRLVAHAALVEFQRRDAQPFLVDLGRIRRVRARHPAADIGLVAHRTGPGDGFFIPEDRLEDEDVGQVHAALERIVQDEHVAGINLPRECRLHRGDRGRHRAQMPGQGQPLRDQHAVAVEQRRRIIHVVLEDARIGRAKHGQRHLVGDPEQRVFEQFELDRVTDHRATSAWRFRLQRRPHRQASAT